MPAFFVCDRKHSGKVEDGAVGNEMLTAVEHSLVVLKFRSGLDVGCVQDLPIYKAHYGHTTDFGRLDSPLNRHRNRSFPALRRLSARLPIRLDRVARI